MKYLSLLLFMGLAWGKMFDTKGISIGIGDSETGFSIFGLSVSKHFNEKHANQLITKISMCFMPHYSQEILYFTKEN